MSDTKELVIIEETSVLTAFTDDGMGNLLEKIETSALAIVPSLETAASRKEIASLSRRVATSKRMIDDVGKEMVSEWKVKSKAVDAVRRVARDRLDTLRDKIREPLTEWESVETKRIEAEALAVEIEAAHLEAVEYNTYIDNLADMKRREAEMAEREHNMAVAENRRQAAIEREEHAKQQAERDKRDEAAQEKAAVAAEVERKNAEAKAEKERKSKAKQDAIDEEKRIEAARKAERERIEREQAEQAVKEKESQEKREANKRHVNKVNKEAMAAISSVGISNDDAYKVIQAIIEGKIPHVTINY